MKNDWRAVLAVALGLSPTKNDTATHASASKRSYGTFGNPVTGIYVSGLIVLLVYGALLILQGCCLGEASLALVLQGQACIGLVVFLAWSGWTKLGFQKAEGKDNKSGKEVPYAAFITFLDSSLGWGGKCFTVNKTTIVPPWWLGFGVVKTDMTPFEMSFEPNVITRDMIQLPVKSILVYTPSLDYLHVFTSYGGWEKIKPDLEGVVSESVEKVTEVNDLIPIARSGSIVSGAIEKTIHDLHLCSKMGITSKLPVRVICKVPDSIAGKMEAVEEARLEAIARGITSDTVMAQAKKISSDSGGKITLEKAIALAKQAQLLDGDKIFRHEFAVETDGNVHIGTIMVTPTNPQQKEPKDKNKGKDK